MDWRLVRKALWLEDNLSYERNEDRGYKGRLLQLRTPFLKAIGKSESSVETRESPCIKEGDEGTSVFSGAISNSSLITGSDD